MTAVLHPEYESEVSEADLVYVSDELPGIRRLKLRGGFRYLDPDGRPLHDPRTLARIKALAVPPAWTDVWICPQPDGHIQATGRDAKGRKQYRYHARWREVRDRTKYERVLAFGEALPRLRRRVARDLGRPGLPREKVLATVIRLLETTLIRVGNEEYARQNGSFGLTTLRNRHVDVAGSELRFEFKGKSGKTHRVCVQDRRLARIVKQCQEIKGQDLFQYIDEEGERRKVGSADVNAYLKELTGEDFTAKDYRTWAATVLTTVGLLKADDSEYSDPKRHLNAVIESVARELGNTPAVCRKSYVHPEIVERYLEGRLALPSQKASVAGLRPEEAALLALFRQASRA